MKIKPEKEYKKPKFAAALGALSALVGALTGCGPEIRGDVPMVEDTSTDAPVTTAQPQLVGTVVTTTEPVLDGAFPVPEDTAATTTEPLVLEGVPDDVELIGEVALEGDVPFIPETEETEDVTLSGDVAVFEEEVPDEPEIAGAVPVVTEPVEAIDEPLEEVTLAGDIAVEEDE